MVLAPGGEKYIGNVEPIFEASARDEETVYAQSRLGSFLNNEDFERLNSIRMSSGLFKSELGGELAVKLDDPIKEIS